MTATYQLPAGKTVADFLGDLYGLSVSASDASEADFTYGAIGVYVNEDGDAQGYVACDIAGGAKLGAALTQVPMGPVEDAIKDGALPENLAENLFEVLNISVNLFEGNDGSRIVFQKLVTDSAEVGELREKVDACEKVVTTIDIQRYGDGKVMIAVPA